MNDPLAELKDIHLPADISWWPPAPGWWLLLALLLASLTAGFYLLRYYRKHHAWRKAARRELNHINHSVSDNSAANEAIATLVRRCAITAASSRGQAQAVAQLQGSAWQQYLQQDMPAEAAHWLAFGRYQPDQAIDRQVLASAVAQWLRKIQS